jgi:hypothetical protein
MLTTLAQFKQAVAQLADISDAYYVFEQQCTDSLRDEIYALAAANTPEPFRSAMHNMGYTNY